MKWKIDEAKDLPLAIIEDTEDGYGIAEIGKRNKRNIANAHIIAAAPELLEALKDALNEKNMSQMSYRIRAYQAIAKAEGR